MNADFNYGEFVHSRFKQDTLPMMYIHAVFGIVGEAIEHLYATEGDHPKEELGDWYFYFTELCRLEGVMSVELLAGDPPLDPQATLLSSSNEIMDLIKKWAIYGNGLKRDQLRFHMMQAMNQFVHYIHNYKLTLHEVIEYNVAKLTKRYPQGKFTSADAEARADKVAD